MIQIAHRFSLAMITLGFSSPFLGKVASADWPRWRGEHDNGSIASGKYPESLADDHVLWSADLPGKGCSTPVISDGQIFVTAPVDGKDALLAFDLSGSEMWRTAFGVQEKGKHRNGSGSNSSPVTDGQNVFVNFKSGTLAAVGKDGKTCWQTNLVERFGKDTLFWDFGTSPVLTEKYVIMTRMHKGQSWLAAFEKATGEMAWKVDRNYTTPVECDHGYSTPLVVSYAGKECVMVWGAEHLTLHDATNGESIWECGNFNPDQNRLWPSIATPVVFGDTVVIAYGRNDRKDPRLHGVQLKGSGDVTSESHRWMRDDVGTFVPSPVGYLGKLYLVRDRGEVECIDPLSGKTIWSAKLPKGRANYYASPLIANGVLYAAREDGVVYVGRVNSDGFELLSERKMGQPVIGSPVPFDGKILIRGEKQLVCFGVSSSPSP